MHEQVSGPSKYKRAAEFVINTAMRGAVDAARRACKAAADTTHKAEAAQKQAAEASATFFSSAFQQVSTTVTWLLKQSWP